MTTARTDDSEPKKLLYEAMTIDNYVISIQPEMEVTIGSVSIRDIKGRPTKVPFTALVPLMTDLKDKKEPSPEAMMKIGGFAVDFIRSFEFGATEMRDMTVKLPPEAGVKALKIGRLAMNGFAEGRLGEYVFEGFDIDAKDGKAKLGQFALRGLGFKSALDALDAALAQGPSGFETLDPKGMIPTLDQVVLSGMDFDVPDEKQKTPGSRIKFSLGKVEYTGSNFINGLPSTAGLAMEKLFMDLTASKDPQFNDLKAAGFKSLDLSTRLDIGWIEAAKTLGVRYSGGLAGMGGLAFKGSLGNVTKDVFSLDEGLTMAAALGAVLMDAEVRLDNAGLFERALEIEAKKEKKSVDQLRKDWISAAAVGIPALLDNSPAAKTIANAVAKFVAQPKNLRIGGKSAQGLGVADLALIGAPADLLKKISVSAAVNE